MPEGDRENKYSQSTGENPQMHTSYNTDIPTILQYGYSYNIDISERLRIFL